MPPFLTVLVLLALTLPHRVPPAPHQLPDPVPAPAPLVLRVDLPDLAPAGMTVPFRLALANRGRIPVTVELAGQPIAFDLVVRSGDGRLVWRRLEGFAVEAAPAIRTLAPGEVLTFDGHWNQRDGEGRPVPPGLYNVRGVLPVADAPGGWGSAPREITIIR